MASQSKFHGAIQTLRRLFIFDTVLIAAGDLSAGSLTALPFFDVGIGDTGAGFSTAKTDSVTNAPSGGLDTDLGVFLPDGEIYVGFILKDPTAATGDAANDLARIMGALPALEYEDNTASGNWRPVAPVEMLGGPAGGLVREDVGQLFANNALIGRIKLPQSAELVGRNKPRFRLTNVAGGTTAGDVYARIVIPGIPQA